MRGRILSLARKNLLAGLVFVAFAAFFGLTAVFDLSLGTPRRMGPGFVPALLAGSLALVGIAILIDSLRGDQEAISDIPWRGVALISASIVLFGMTVRPFGVLLPLTVSVFLASFASSKTTLARAVIVTLALVIVTLGIFKYALGRPMPLFGPLLPF